MRIRSLYRESFADRRASLTLLAKKSLSSAGAVPPPSDQPAVVASSLSGRPAGHVADYLGRESEIVSLSSYFFDSVFYEANQSSSACRLGLNLKSKPVRPPVQWVRYSMLDRARKQWEVPVEKRVF